MYTDYFGFSEEPFNATPDPRFLYLTARHEEALAAMVYGIKAKKGFISIVGEIGTGKTTLLRSLFDKLDETIETVFIFNTTAHFDQLLKYIMLDLNIPTSGEGKLELIFKLNRFLIEKLANGSTVALIIDEAHNLSSQVLEELRMLSNMETATEKLLQIVLVGQPELHDKINLPNLRQLKNRIGINRDLTPLQDEEVREYIAHRLTIAGCQEEQIFSQKALGLICKHSKGIPRTINILCDNALLSAYSKDRKTIDAAIAEEVIVNFEGTKTPVNENTTVINPVQEVGKPHQGLPTGFTKARLALVSLVLAILIFSALVISAYDDTLHSLNHFISTVFANLSITRQDTNLPAENFTVTNSPQKSQILSGHTVNENSNHEKPLLHEQMPATLKDHVVTPDASSAQKHYNVVYAKSDDSISSLALREYGIANNLILDIIKRANPEIKVLDQIRDGQKVNLPLLNSDSIIMESSTGGYSVHLATSSSIDEAQQNLKNYSGYDYPVSIAPVQITGEKPWYRTTTGDFPSREQASAYAARINFDKLLFPFTAETPQ